MSKIDHLGRRFGAVVLLLTTLWALPAWAGAAGAEPGAVAAAESATGPNDRLAVLYDSDAMALAAKRKRKPARVVRAQPTRLAALSRQDWSWSTAWSGRHFILMIGIGY